MTPPDGIEQLSNTGEPRRVEQARVRAEFAARRAAAMPRRHRQRLANLRRSADGREFLAKMEQLAAKTRDTPTVDTCTGTHMSDNLLIMAGERSAGTTLLPASVPIRAMLAGEMSRAVRRSQDVRRALSNPDLLPWLNLVDTQCPDLIDTERVRLAQICRRNADSHTPEGD